MGPGGTRGQFSLRGEYLVERVGVGEGMLPGWLEEGVVFGGGGTKGFKFLDSRPPHSIHTSPTLQAGLSQVPGSTPRPKCS